MRQAVKCVTQKIRPCRVRPTYPRPPLPAPAPAYSYGAPHYYQNGRALHPATLTEEFGGGENELDPLNYTIPYMDKYLVMAMADGRRRRVETRQSRRRGRQVMLGKSPGEIWVSSATSTSQKRRTQ